MVPNAATRQRMAVLMLTIAGFFVLTGHSDAENRFALVIGNGAYATVGQLPNARNDANVIGQALKQMDFEVEILVDLDEEGMGKALDRLADKVEQVDVAALYYAGHGLQVNSQNYLVPVDARIETELSVAREAPDLQSFLDVLSRAPISLIFLDACRNNPFAERLAAQAKSSGRSTRISRGLASVAAQGDQLIAFATLPNEVSSDGAGENSPFAKALAKHIPVPDVEISVMMKRVTADVLIETEDKQRPQQLTQMKKEFYFQKAAITQGDAVTALSIYPQILTTGEELTLIADMPSSCVPAFFNLSPGNRATPIPGRFFKTLALRPGEARYEISAGSRYGLVVQEQDERGNHRIGFFCEPPGLDGKQAKVELLRALTARLKDGDLTGSFAGPAGEPVTYRFDDYTVR
jgi:hypothetical protein